MKSRRPASPPRPVRAVFGALMVVAGVIACSGIITGPDAGPDTSPRSMRVSPARLELSLADTARMSANLYDVAGAAAVLDPAIPVRFRSADTLVARVDSTGLVTAIADGATTVTASYGALQLGIPVVVLGRLRIQIVSGNAQTAEQGDTLALPLVVRALDAAGQPVVGGVLAFTVTSGAGALAQVQGTTDANGRASARWVLGLPLGAQAVAVTAAGFDSAAFNATAIAGTRAVTLALLPQDTTLVGAGNTVQLSATVRNVAGVVLPAAPVAYVSTIPAAATVSATGVVTSVAPGITYVRATSGAAVDSMRVEVLALPIITVAPTSVAVATPAGSSPAATTIAVTNGGGSRLSGLSASIVYGAGATGWLAIAFDSTAAPATLTLTSSTATVPVGSYAATITIASSVAGVASRSVPVTLDVTSVGPLPKLFLGLDQGHAIGLQAEYVGELPAPAATPLVLTLRSLDSTQVMLAADSETRGRDSITIVLGAGRQTFAYWIQGIGDGFPDARVVVEAPGYDPDTVAITLSVPAVQLSLVTPSPVPATGGPEPVLQVTVGFNDDGSLVPMQVRAFGPAPVFEVETAVPDLARLRFRATAATIGADQGPAETVSFALRPGRSATSLPDSQFAIPASLGVVLNGQSGEVAFVVTGPPEYFVLGGNPVLRIASLRALSLGVDTLQPAWLHSEREVTLESTVSDPVDVTIRSLDPSTVRVAASQNNAGTAQIVTQVEGGTRNAFYWLSGVPGASGRTARVVAEAAGYRPDTILVTVTRPAYTLSRFGAGTVPASGGEDPVFVVTVGEAFGDGGFRPMALSPGITPPEFTLQADQPSIARVQFFASTSTVGADQGPASSVTFSLQDGQNSTSTGQFLGTPASLRAARTGVAGGATISMSVAPAEFDNVQSAVGFTFTAPAVPVIAVAPGSLTFTANAGANPPPTQQVLVTSASTGTLSGLAAELLYGAGASDWLAVTFDSTTAPATMSVSVDPEFVSAGGYAATIRLTSTTPGVAPRDVAVTFNALGPARIVIVSGNDQVVAPGELAPDSLKVRALMADGTPLRDGLVSFTVSAGGGSISPTSAVTDVDGFVATKWRMSDVPGTHTVTVTRDGFLSAVFTGTASNPGAAATQLVLTTQPAGAVLGVDLTTQPVVEVRDAANGLVAGSTAAVTAAITSGDGTLEGTTTVTAVAGVATFTTLRISGARGVDPTITFTSSGLASVAATPLTVAEPVQPTFATQPVSLQVPAGQDARFVVAVSGLPTPTLQWQESTDLGSTYSDIAGETGTTFAVIGVTYPSYRYFRVRATNVLGARFSQAVTLEVLAPPPPCDVGVGSATVTGAPATVEGAFCPQTATPPGTPNGAGNVSVGWSETFDYGNGSYFETVSIQFNATTGAVVGVSHYLNDPTRSIISSCSPLPSAPPPCAGVTMDLVNRAVTFTNLVLGNGSPITLNGTLTWQAPPVIGVSPDSIGFTVVAGATTAPAQTVIASNIGGGTLSGFVIEVLYGAGASDWLFMTSDGNVPATITLDPQPAFLPVGTYRAIVEVASFLPVVAPETVVVTMTVTAPVTTIALDIAGEDLVGVGLSTMLDVTLGAPAGAGGVTVTVTSDNASMVGVTAPGTVSIAAGQSTGQVELNGLSVGATVVRATASGYTDGTLPVVATNQIISLPTTLNVPYGLTTSIPVQLATPAPAGGVVVTLSSTDPSAVGVVTTTVTLPPGTTLASGTLSGVAPGAATITATATGWVSDATTATTTALLNVVEPSLGINATFGGTMTIELRSGAAAIAAPAPGVTVALSAVNTACVAVPATVTIPTGQTSVTAAVSYGGTATTPCASYVRATATNMQADSLNVSVAAAPGITVGGATLGAGLQAPTGAGLGATNYGATTIRIESSNPALFLIAPNASTVGSAFLDIPLVQPNTNASYVIQALEGVTGTGIVTATASGFTTGTATVIVRGLGVEFLSVPGTTTSLSPNQLLQARIGTLDAAGTVIESEYAIRAGGVPLIATITNSNAAAAQLATTALTGQSVTAQIVVGQTRTPGSLASGGFEFDPIASGSTNVSVSIPGVTGLAGATRPVVISAPVITVNAATLGAGLQAGTSAGLGATDYGTVTMRIESSDPALFLVAPNASTVGSAFVDVPLTAPSTSASFVIQALEGVTGTGTITATAPGFTTGTATMTVRGLGVEFLSVPATTTSLSPSQLLQVRIGTLDAAGTVIESEFALRTGGAPLTATITNSNATAAQLVTSALTGQSVTVPIVVGQTRTPGSLASGGFAFDPLASGSTNVSVSIPGVTSLAGATRPVTISAPVITTDNATLGAGLQSGWSSGLGATDFGATTVRVESSDPSRLLIAPNASTVGGAFLDIPLTAPSTSAGYVLQVLEGATGSATITTTAPGFVASTATVTFRGLGVEFLSVPATTTSLSPNQLLQVRIGQLDASGTVIEAEFALRTGGVPLTATITNGNSTVAQLVTMALTGQSVTAPIAIGQTRTPGSLATGGFEFDPLSSGTTTVSVSIPGVTSLAGASRPVVISAPGISVSASTLGAGLQAGASAGLGATDFGSTTMRIESSNPALFLIAPNASTVGSAFLDVALTAPSTSASYVIQTLEGVTGTGTITVSAPGFTSANATVTVRGLGVEFLSVPTTISAGATDLLLQARIGTLNAAGTAIESEFALRTGGVPLTATIASSNGSAAQLVTTALTGASVTAGIAIGQTRTPGSVGTGGFALDPLAGGTTTLSVSIPGVTSVPGSARTVTVTP